MENFKKTLDFFVHICYNVNRNRYVLGTMVFNILLSLNMRNISKSVVNGMGNISI